MEPRAPHTPSTFIKDEVYNEIEASMPIACVDAILVKIADGEKHYGLIRRKDTIGERVVWCHAGGRIIRGMTIIETIAKHLNDDLGIKDFDPPDVSKPLAIVEYLPHFVSPNTPFDLRKHGISLLYEVQVIGEPNPQGKEALGFEWFSRKKFPKAEEFGFGHGKTIRQAIGLA